jgi:hypothetical protein
MARALCSCEPNVAYAGDIGEWKFHYSPGSNLPKGTKIKFDLLTPGRSIDWQIPEVGSKNGENVIYGILPNEKIVEAAEIEVTDTYVPQYEFVLPSEIKEGETFTIVMGKPNPKSKEPTGIAAQSVVQRRRPFNLHIDKKGKGYFEEPDVFLLDVRGNQLHSIKVQSPSFVGKNKRFDVTVRFEDAFGNLTNRAPENTLIELSYEQLRDNLKWKLFVPETGFITLPNLYFNEEGTYTITLKNLTSGEQFKSSPIRCYNELEGGLFWGINHGESERVDSTEHIETCLRHFRDDRAMNYFIASPFEDIDETPNEIWKLIGNNIAEFNEAERFATMLGFQWASDKPDEGVRQFVYAKDTKTILRKSDPKYNSLKKIYKLISPREVICIPSFTMGGEYGFNFDTLYNEFERVVEIYNAWGSSECLLKEGNTHPIKCPGKGGFNEVAHGSIRKALIDGHRFGFVAGGLDDRGIYSDLFESPQEQYTPGLTGVIAKDLSRESIFDAIYDRSCYATTGEKMILDFHIAGTKMGGEVKTEDKPGLRVNRHIAGFVAGTNKLVSVELFRNGQLMKSFSAEGYSFDYEYDDMTPIDQHLLTSKNVEHPFLFYYLRVKQADGHVAWSSPIWIDDTLAGEKAKKKK